MEILTQIEKDYNQAFKGKNELAVLVLRGLKTALTNAEIAKNRQPLTAEEIIKVLRGEAKKRKDASELYLKGGRPELAEKEQKEIVIVSRYLPPELSEEKIREKIAAVIAKAGAAGPQDTGKIMGLVMKELAGTADGQVVSRLVKEELSR